MLEIEGLTAGYHHTPVLRDVSVTVERGEIVGVMGKNGVGKTTLVKTVMGLLDPTTGTITFDGDDVTHAPADVRARMGMGYIPQGRDVFPDLTVEQNLRMGGTVNTGTAGPIERVRGVLADPRSVLGDDDPPLDRIYEYFPILEERADQRAGSLSGGQQQMLAIGRALVGDPDLLVLDEPSEGIQPSIVEQIHQDMRAINADLDTTILFVEQNLEVIRAMADRCYAMERGVIGAELDGETLADAEATAEYLAI
ncbi:ABC transporter ATP-binding protein [Halococcoides cellulosivorans]|uniref:ABC transporter ATP-binding protein n=1 Tax=Halococcoides cellulosivorans TaxID=1679096 RepID=A0A2R4X0B0_9EURY|nr:ABC transporter ATP-binding protein [Halococcoides cellulosivorans]AWB27230.1 ABC transporter ATP-binding protein [Halococcoides cellulosivorans]